MENRLRVATQLVGMEDCLHAHPAFEPGKEGFVLPSSPLEAVVLPENGCLVVRARMPTLAAVVRDATVASVVEDSWYDTLSRRLKTGHDVTRVEAASDPSVERDDREVTVTYRLRGEPADTAVDDAKALVEFVVGTYLQGAIPGYAYDSPMRELLDNAHRRGSADGGA